MGNYSSSTATKVCASCGKSIPLSEYHANGKSPDGKRDRCPDCIKAKKPKQVPEKVRKNDIKDEPDGEPDAPHAPHGYMYVIQEREFIKTNENVYKIGMTNQYNPRTRLQKYPADSCVYLLIRKHDARNSENIGKDMLKGRRDVKHRSDIGEEYFEGDIQSIINVILIC
jgi:hypothetical protein